MNIKQFKLTNNEEIVCEVVEWDTQDEVGDILVKKALRIIAIEDYQKGWRFFKKERSMARKRMATKRN